MTKEKNSLGFFNMLLLFCGLIIIYAVPVYYSIYGYINEGLAFYTVIFAMIIIAIKYGD